MAAIQDGNDSSNGIPLEAIQEGIDQAKRPSGWTQQDAERIATLVMQATKSERDLLLDDVVSAVAPSYPFETLRDTIIAGSVIIASTALFGAIGVYAWWYGFASGAPVISVAGAFLLGLIIYHLTRVMQSVSK